MDSLLYLPQSWSNFDKYPDSIVVLGQARPLYKNVLFLKDEINRKLGFKEGRSTYARNWGMSSTM